MHRAVILLVGLLLCVSAAAIVLPPVVTVARPTPLPMASAAPVSVQRRVDGGWNARGGPSGYTTLKIQSSIAANRVESGKQVDLQVAGLLVGGGATVLVVWTVTRGIRGAGRRRAMRTGVLGVSEAPAAVDPRAARPFSPTSTAVTLSASVVPAPAAIRAERAALHSEPTGDAKRGPHNQQRHRGAGYPFEASSAAETPPALDWLRSEAGDNRAAAALCAVDEVLAAGGWRSRTAGALTRPDARRAEVQVALALHPAERNIGAAVAERIAAMHTTWHAGYDGEQLSIDVPEVAGSPQALLLPALQLDADGPWTQYIHAPATLGLAISGSGAGDILHGVLADLVCIYPPADLALTVFSSAAELYRAAPQWVEPPVLGAQSIDLIAQHIHVERSGGIVRPLLLAAVEPDDELLRAMLALQQRAGVLRSPPFALLVAAERPGAEFRSLAAALPALSARPAAGPRSAELRLAERRIVGQPPRFAANDMRELLRWLPRFGASPPPCIWDTSITALQSAPVGDDDDRESNRP